QRFKNEARAAAQLHHTNIVPVHAVGCERGVHYYAMQFIEGQTLAALVREWRRSARRHRAGPEGPRLEPVLPTVAHLGNQAAEALAYAHRQGVVHRDIKPTNLIVDRRDNLWIADFGLARFHRDAGLTLPGDLVGTLRYMSPEQALGGRPVDHRVDIYSLGV